MMAGHNHGKSGTSNRPNLHTSTELAQAVARLDLDATRTLSRRSWSTSADLFARIGKLLPKMASKAAKITWDRFDVETALDVLVIRGLAEAEVEDVRVTETRPQRYRWSKLATVESLERFVSNVRRCERAGCEVVMRDDNGRARYCSDRCRHAHTAHGRGKVR